MCNVITKALGLDPPKPPKPVQITPPPAAPADPNRGLRQPAEAPRPTLPLIGDRRRGVSAGLSELDVRSGVTVPLNAVYRSGLQIGGLS